MATGRSGGRGLEGVFGGLEILLNETAAGERLKAKPADLGAGEATAIFAKGDFQDIMFAKFATESIRDEAVTKFWQSKTKLAGRFTWSREDQPIEQRVPESFLFGLRKVLMAWQYTKGEIWIDKVDLVLKIDGEPVVRARVSNGKFEANW